MNRCPAAYHARRVLLPEPVRALTDIAYRDGAAITLQSMGVYPIKAHVFAATGSELELRLAGSCGLFRAVSQAGEITEWVWSAFCSTN